MIIPFFVLFTKIAVNILFQVTYNASFIDDTIFPFLKRATAIGICNFFARLATVSAPWVVDLQKPWPEVILLIVVGFSCVVAFTLPLDDFDEMVENEPRITSHAMSEDPKEGGSEVSAIRLQKLLARHQNQDSSFNLPRPPKKRERVLSGEFNPETSYGRLRGLSSKAKLE